MSGISSFPKEKPILPVHRIGFSLSWELRCNRSFDPYVMLAIPKEKGVMVVATITPSLISGNLVANEIFVSLFN
jgi:hypothetical protein